MYMMLRRVNSLNKVCLLHLCGLPATPPPSPHMNTLKPPFNFVANQSHVDMTFMTRQHTQFPLTPSPLRKTLCQAIHWPHRPN